jgi:hypothetical protein
MRHHVQHIEFLHHVISGIDGNLMSFFTLNSPFTSR